MKLSKKQKIILWVTVILIVIFLGLHSERVGQTKTVLSLYGYRIATDFPSDLRLLPAYLKRGIGSFAYLGKWKYPLIVATLLIGFALFMTVREK